MRSYQTLLYWLPGLLNLHWFLFGPAASLQIEVANSVGLIVVREAFIDCTYQDNGNMTS